MTKQQARIWWKNVTAHVEGRLKDAVREGIQAHWPEAKEYDPDTAPKGRELYEKFKKEVYGVLRRVKP